MGIFMQDIKKSEKPVRYKARKFGLLPEDVLAQVFNYLTVWNIFNLKLTSFSHYILLKKFLSRDKDYFKTRINMTFTLEQQGTFMKLSWNSLIVRENVYIILKRDIKSGLLEMYETRENNFRFFGFIKGNEENTEPLYRLGKCTLNQSFKITDLANSIMTDNPSQLLSCTTRFSQLSAFFCHDNPDMVVMKNAFDGLDARLREQTGEKLQYLEFRFLRLLPYIMQARAMKCFEFSIRTAACACLSMNLRIQDLIVPINIDITTLIISSNVHFFMEKYFYLLTCVYPAGHIEIMEVIDRYHANNLLGCIKKSMLSIKKEHINAIKSAYEKNREKESVFAELFPEKAKENLLLIEVIRNNEQKLIEQSSLKGEAIDELNSLLGFLRQDKVDIKQFQLQKMLLEEALEKLNQNLVGCNFLEEVDEITSTELMNYQKFLPN